MPDVDNNYHAGQLVFPSCNPVPVDRRFSPWQAQKLAQVAAKPNAATMRQRVFEVISTHGPISDERGAELLGIEGNTYRPRRKELEVVGRICPSGRKETTHSGRQAVAWTVAPGT